MKHNIYWKLNDPWFQPNFSLSSFDYAKERYMFQSRAIGRGMVVPSRARRATLNQTSKRWPFLYLCVALATWRMSVGSGPQLLHLALKHWRQRHWDNRTLDIFARRRSHSAPRPGGYATGVRLRSLYRPALTRQSVENSFLLCPLHRKQDNFSL